MKKFLFVVVFLLLPGIFGCDRDASKVLVGTWELLTIDGKTPEVHFQRDLESQETNVLAAALKLVFASDGSLFQEVSFSLQVPMPGISSRIQMVVTVNGSYVVSSSTIEFISGDRANIEFNISDNNGDAEFEQLLLDEKLNFGQEESERLKRSIESGRNLARNLFVLVGAVGLELEQESNYGELEGELEQLLEQELAQNFELELTTYTWKLKGDLLTLRNGSEKVYRKR